MQRHRSTRRSRVPWLVLVGGGATITMAVVALLKPNFAWPALLFFLIGLLATLRHYWRWRAD